jgi:hypothetical protein
MSIEVKNLKMKFKSMLSLMMTKLRMKMRTKMKSELLKMKISMLNMVRRTLKNAFIRVLM